MKNENKMKVLLIQPNYARERKYTKYCVSPPLGLAYIAAALEKNAITVEILDANALNLDVDDVVQQAVTTRATIVGVSILMTGYKYSIAIARKLPKTILSVAGGAYPSGAPADLLMNGFDVAVKGRGERAMLELSLNKNIEEIPGIYYWRNNKIIHNPPRPAEDLKSNPLFLPARHLLVNNGVDKPYSLAGTMYFPWSPVFTSVGCPYNCYFCSKQVFDRFLSREAVDIVEEIRELVEKYKVKEIDIYDDCFNADRSRAEQILDLIIKYKLDIKLRFPNGIKANNITRSFMEKMKRAGCVEVAYGIESGDQEVLDRIPKRVSLDEIRKAVKYTKEVSILTVGFFILGLLGDNEKSMQRTIAFAKELQVDVAFFSILTPYPGTLLWNLIAQGGNFFIKDYDDLHQSSGKMVFSHPDFPPPDLTEEMYRKAYKEFYFSPKYIFKRLLGLKNPAQLSLNVKGLFHLLKTQFIKNE